MKSRIPKPLHNLCGLPLTRHVVESCRAIGIEQVILVVRHEAEAVMAGLGSDVVYAMQGEHDGSGAAARAAEKPLAQFDGNVLVLAGDVPLLRPETLQSLLDHHIATGAAATLLTAVLDDAKAYGRIVRNADGTVARIVEYKDANEDQRAIREWNPSIYAFKATDLFAALREVRSDNAQNEYYLTDVIGILAAQNKRIEALPTDDVNEVVGVNTLVELAEVARTKRNRVLQALMLSGVTITDPANTYIDAQVRIAANTVIEPNTYLHGATVIGEGCVIGPGARLIDATVGNNTTVLISQIVQSRLGDSVYVGPFANLRPGCDVADRCKIGDFVELKKTKLGEKVSAGHLTYLGDAEIGAYTNIGAGTITCNYDGVNKHRTVVGEKAFIGSHTTMVAPVNVGAGAFTAAGSTITSDVPEDALAFGRSRQVIKPEWARRRRETMGK